MEESNSIFFNNVRRGNGPLRRVSFNRKNKFKKNLILFVLKPRLQGTIAPSDIIKKYTIGLLLKASFYRQLN